jgi:hypothetical protein
MYNYFDSERPIYSIKQSIFILTTLIFFLPLTLISALLVLSKIPASVIDEVKIHKYNLLEVPVSGVSVFAALPTDPGLVTVNFLEDNARVEIVRQYLIKYNSPLAPYAKTIVEEADKNGLDFRLTTAIAQQESNLCKRIPAESYNCWGWGIHSRGTLGFTDFEEGVKVVSKGIRNAYINEGLITIEEIMSKYTPLSSGSWANGVTLFMSQMK